MNFPVMKEIFTVSPAKNAADGLFSALCASKNKCRKQENEKNFYEHYHNVSADRGGGIIIA
jgi:hypothetical protein